MKNIVILGGGTGTSTLLKGLKKYPANLSVVVSSWDDGGSNGRLRKELKAFPFSDIRQCLVALGEEGYWKDFFSFRFNKGPLNGHTAANLFLAELERITKSVTEPINIAKQLLNVKAQIYPATLSPAVLSAVLENGKKIIGEHLIDCPQKGKFSRIKNLKLVATKPNPEAAKAILKADVLVLGPGDLFTSILPNLLAPGLGEAVRKSKAKKVFVGNLMTKDGQTNGFKASDLVLEILSHVPNLDYAILNKKLPPKNILQKYRHDKSEMVALDKEVLKSLDVYPVRSPMPFGIGSSDRSELTSNGVNIILEDLLVSKEAKKVKGDILKRSFLRHNSEVLAKLIWQMV